MVFTESDAENNGLIKREVGREMAKVAQSQNPQLFQFFEKVAEDIGREPSDIFGEMAVRAMEDEAFADRIFNSEVNMRELRADQIRMEDIQYVQELTEQLGLNEKEESEDPIEQLIEQRLENVTQSPLSQLTETQTGGGQSSGQQSANMAAVEERLARMEKRIAEDQDNESETHEETQSQERKSVDDLFDDDGGEPNDDGHTTDQLVDDTDNGDGTSDTLEMGNGGEQEEEDETEEGPGDSPDDVDIDEALDGVVGDDEQEEAQEDEQLDMSIDIPAEQEEEDNGMFTSEDGVEE